MKFLLDANVPFGLVKLLKSRKLKILHLLDTDLKSASDEAVFNYAVKKRMTIITFDKDFLGDEFQRQSHYGVIFFKVKTPDLALLADVFLRAISGFRNLKNKFLSIELK